MTVLTSAIAGAVTQNSPSKAYANTPTHNLRTQDSHNSYAYWLFGGVPSGPTTYVEGTHLDFFTQNAWSGSVTVTMTLVTSSWSPSTATYNNQPSLGDITSSVTVSNAAANQAVSVDMTDLVTAWASGTPNYGFRIDVSGTTTRALWSVGASGKSAKYKPTLTVVTSTAPPAPTGLAPAFGQQVSVAKPTLTWVYASVSPMTAYQVQLNTSDSWTSPVYDSGVVSASTPQHTLTADISDGDLRYWRVRVRNSAGQWSPYSSSVSFGYTVKPALTISAPADGATVHDVTPPVVWSLASGTQTQYELRLLDATGKVLGTSGQVPGAITSASLSVPIPTVGDDYTLQVRVLDDVDRASTPGDSPWIVASTTVIYASGSGVEVFAVFKALTMEPKPFVQLIATRSELPDGITIFRDGVPIAQPDPASIWDGDTGYSWIDTTASPKTVHTYVMTAVVDGVGTDSAAQSVDVKSFYLWLLDPDDPDWWLALDGQDELGLALGDSSVMYTVRGSDRQVMVADTLRGYEGTVSGGLHSSLPGLNQMTAQDLRNRIWRTKADSTHVYRLVAADMNIPVIVRAMNVIPSPIAELNYGVTFEAYQQGELPW